MKDKIINFLKAGYAGLYVQSHEGQRVEGEVAAAAKTAGFDFYTWSATRGVVQIKPAKGSKPAEAIQHPANPDLQPHYDALSHFLRFAKAARATEGGKGVMLLHDFHLFLKQEDPVFVRMVKDCLLEGKFASHTLVIVGCQLVLPPELEKEITLIEFKLPDRDALLTIATNIATSAGIELNGNTEAILDAASGCTTIEAENSMALSIVESKNLTPAVIAREKASALKSSGILEVVESGITFDDIGGLEELKSWIKRRERAFTKEAQDYHLPRPKGVCLYGVQGCGKSFATKAIANELNVPLLKLDAGKLFGSLVGQSEATTRAVIQQVEAFGKCVLQIEELDKSFAGMKSAQDGDSGTTRRVIGTFLTWMQEKTSPVFIVATANDLTKLPPELLRKGRWDELWFIDLPTETERAEIWKVQIKRHYRAPKEFDIGALAKITDGWSGAEIEALFGEGLYAAFDENREPDTELLVKLSKDTAPLSKMMAAEIEGLRQWSAGKARRASRPQLVEVESRGRKIID